MICCHSAFGNNLVRGITPSEWRESVECKNLHNLQHFCTIDILSIGALHVLFSSNSRSTALLAHPLPPDLHTIYGEPLVARAQVENSNRRPFCSQEDRVSNVRHGVLDFSTDLLFRFVMRATFNPSLRPCLHFCLRSLAITSKLLTVQEVGVVSNHGFFTLFEVTDTTTSLFQAVFVRFFSTSTDGTVWAASFMSSTVATGQADYF